MIDYSNHLWGSNILKNHFHHKERMMRDRHEKFFEAETMRQEARWHGK